MSSWSKRQYAELVFVPAFAFLPSILSSLQLFITPAEPGLHTDYTSSTLYAIFYQGLSLLILYHVLRGRGETISDLGVTFSRKDVVYGVMLFSIVFGFNYAIK